MDELAKKRWLNKVVAHEGGPGALCTLVFDLKHNEACEIANRGMDAQMEWLLENLTPEDIKQWMASYVLHEVKEETK